MMRFLNIVILTITVVFFNACATKNISYSSSKFNLNFVNKTDSSIKDVSIYSEKENKKVVFSHIPKNGVTSYAIFKKSKNENIIVLSWKYKNRIFTHKINTGNRSNQKVDFINLNLFSNGEYTVLVSHTA